MTSNIKTPMFRAVWVQLFEPKAFKNDPGGKKTFSLKAAFPPDADLSEMKAQAALAAREKWGDRLPSSLKSPFQKNGDRDNPTKEIPDDWVIINFTSNENRKPGVVDRHREIIEDSRACYSGAWFRAQVIARPYDTGSNKGVKFYLQNVQKLKDDAAIGGGNAPASTVFDAYEPPEASAAEDMFA